MKQTASHQHKAAVTGNGTEKAVTKNQILSGEQHLLTYDPNHLLDTLMRHFGIDNDGALARRLKIARDLLNKIRTGTVPVGASMLLWMQEASGIDVAELRRLMGDRRARYRLGISLQQRAAA